jgi:pimeloyl-ACP methyl ester carboxylesterase
MEVPWLVHRVRAAGRFGQFDESRKDGRKAVFVTARISRRSLLHHISGTATVAVSAMMVGVMPTLRADVQRSTDASQDGRIANGATGDSDALFYREDWLGEPWRKPETVLLIHGVYESGIAWFGWVPRMAQEFRLLRPDLPGFGASRIPARFEWSMGSLTGVLARFLDKVGVESVHVIGAKFGGSIAMQFAADYPQRTRTLVVASGPVRRPVISSNAPGVPQRDRLGSGASKEEVEYWNQLMAAANPEATRGAGRVLSALDLEPVLPRITAPTLVIT